MMRLKQQWPFVHTQADTQRDVGPPRTKVWSWHTDETEVFNKKTTGILGLAQDFLSDRIGFPLEFDCLIGLQARSINPPEFGSRKGMRRNSSVRE
jgi:hypothetical protein